MERILRDDVLKELSCGSLPLNRLFLFCFCLLTQMKFRQNSSTQRSFPSDQGNFLALQIHVFALLEFTLNTMAASEQTWISPVSSGPRVITAIIQSRCQYEAIPPVSSKTDNFQFLSQIWGVLGYGRWLLLSFAAPSAVFPLLSLNPLFAPGSCGPSFHLVSVQSFPD